MYEYSTFERISLLEEYQFSSVSEFKFEKYGTHGRLMWRIMQSPFIA